LKHLQDGGEQQSEQMRQKRLFYAEEYYESCY
jgi:hypothetical protein